MTREEAIAAARLAKAALQEAYGCAADVDWGELLVDSLFALGALALADRVEPSAAVRDERSSLSAYLRFLQKQRIVTEWRTAGPLVVQIKGKLDDFHKEVIAGLTLPGMTIEYVVEADRCEPPLEQQAKRWHWLRTPRGQFEVHRWDHGERRWCPDTIFLSAEELARIGWRYVAPCEEPKTE